MSRVDSCGLAVSHVDSCRLAVSPVDLCVRGLCWQAAGKYKQKGRDYIVEDGDIIHFKFNAGAGLQAKKK